MWQKEFCGWITLRTVRWEDYPKLSRMEHLIQSHAYFKGIRQRESEKRDAITEAES
jgi:hypothetical protein